MPLSPEDLAAEFDMLMARAGLVAPAAHRDSLLAGYAGLRSQVDLLRGNLPATVEPANIFRLGKVGSA